MNLSHIYLAVCFNIYLSFILAFHVLLATKPYVPELIIRPMLEDLQETLEKTENHLIVPTLVNSLALISRQQPRLFEPRFQVRSIKYVVEGVCKKV